MLLFEEYPEAAGMRDEFADLPIHYAFASRQSSSLIQLLFDAYPLAAEKQGYCGSFPLFLHFISLLIIS